jgi:hypothetical protein
MNMLAVARFPGAGKVAQLAALREVSLLGGETRSVAMRLRSPLWTEVAGGRKIEARVLYIGRVGRVFGPSSSATVHLIPGPIHWHGPPGRASA